MPKKHPAKTKPSKMETAPPDPGVAYQGPVNPYLGLVEEYLEQFRVEPNATHEWAYLKIHADKPARWRYPQTLEEWQAVCSNDRPTTVKNFFQVWDALDKTIHRLRIWMGTPDEHAGYQAESLAPRLAVQHLFAMMEISFPEKLNPEEFLKNEKWKAESCYEFVKQAMNRKDADLFRAASNALKRKPQSSYGTAHPKARSVLDAFSYLVGANRKLPTKKMVRERITDRSFRDFDLSKILKDSGLAGLPDAVQSRGPGMIRNSKKGQH